MKRRVLIVDDEPGVRESVSMVLKDAYEPVAVSSGQEALQAVAAQPVDVVLLDIVMPGMDGLQVLEEIHARHPQLPVIMLTATKTVKTAVDAMKLGAFDYLTKPFDVDELRIVLDKATQQRGPGARGRGAAHRGRPALPARQHHRALARHAGRLQDRRSPWRRSRPPC